MKNVRQVYPQPLKGLSDVQLSIEDGAAGGTVMPEQSQLNDFLVPGLKGRGMVLFRAAHIRSGCVKDSAAFSSQGTVGIHFWYLREGRRENISEERLDARIADQHAAFPRVLPQAFSDLVEVRQCRDMREGLDTLVSRAAKKRLYTAQSYGANIAQDDWVNQRIHFRRKNVPKVIADEVSQCPPEERGGRLPAAASLHQLITQDGCSAEVAPIVLMTTDKVKIISRLRIARWRVAGTSPTHVSVVSTLLTHRGRADTTDPQCRLMLGDMTRSIVWLRESRLASPLCVTKRMVN